MSDTSKIEQLDADVESLYHLLERVADGQLEIKGRLTRQATRLDQIEADLQRLAKFMSLSVEAQTAQGIKINRLIQGQTAIEGKIDQVIESLNPDRP